MAYLLLAAGALMAVLGLYAGISGYRIVQVEEGWSSVIAGSVLFAGGILTMALGLVLRTLTELRATIVARPLLAPLETDMFPEPTLPPAAIPATTEATESEAVAPPAQVKKRPSLFGAPTTAEKKEPKAPSAPPAPATPAEPEVIASDDAYKMETPSSPEHDLVAKTPTPAPEPDPEPQAPPSAPIESNWLDRALADLDQELPRSPPPLIKPRSGRLPKSEPFPEQKREPVVAAEVASEKAAVIETPTPEPHAEPEPEPSPAAPPPSAVIGRYEADGTTYVMFADGSIEAQSPNGVYRFTSMAELKSFIEN